MKKVYVASKNPVKLDSVKTGFQKMFPNQEFEIIGVSVSSDVKDQPLSDKETYNGAYNRSNNAKIQYPNGDFRVGIEGGVKKKGDDMESFARIVIKSKDGKTGKAKSGIFFLPKEVAKLILQGKELGEADDIVFNDSNSKQKNGAVGILTGNIIQRSDFYSQIVILGLIPIKNRELY